MLNLLDNILNYIATVIIIITAISLLIYISLIATDNKTYHQTINNVKKSIIDVVSSNDEKLTVIKPLEVKPNEISLTIFQKIGYFLKQAGYLILKVVSNNLKIIFYQILNYIIKIALWALLLAIIAYCSINYFTPSQPTFIGSNLESVWDHCKAIFDLYIKSKFSFI